MSIAPDAPRGGGTWSWPRLGRIVFNFSGLNWCAERLLAGFISADASALLAVASMTTSKKLKELSAIANGTLAMGSLEAKLLRDWVTGATLLNKERNSMLHSVWSGGERPGWMTRITPRVVKGEWRGESSQVASTGSTPSLTTCVSSRRPLRHWPTYSRHVHNGMASASVSSAGIAESGAVGVIVACNARLRT